MRHIDPVIHQPTRLRIMMLLSGVDSADFTFVTETLSLTKGNLSSHMNQLEKAGYIEVTKTFKGRIPNTSYSITQEGIEQLSAYWEAMDEIRRLNPPDEERNTFR